MLRRTHRFVLGLACLLVVISPFAMAKGGQDRVQFGSNIYVGEDESVGDVVCIFCSVRMQGRSGDVVAILGSIRIDGEASGDVVAMGGATRLSENAKVAGDVVAIGGGVHRDNNSKVGGEIVSESGFLVLFLLFIVPLIPMVLLVAFIWWLVTRNRRAPVPVQA